MRSSYQTSDFELKSTLSLQAILCAGLYPNVAATEKGIAEATLSNLKQSAGLATKERPIWFDGRREVSIHPSSINSNLKEFRYPFLVFLEKVCALSFESTLFTFSHSNTLMVTITTKGINKKAIRHTLASQK